MVAAVVPPRSTILVSCVDLHGWLGQKHRTAVQSWCGVPLLHVVATIGLAVTGTTGRRR